MWLSDKMLVVAMLALAGLGIYLAIAVTGTRWRVSFTPDSGGETRAKFFKKKPGIYEAIAKLQGRGTAEEDATFQSVASSRSDELERL